MVRMRLASAYRAAVASKPQPWMSRLVRPDVYSTQTHNARLSDARGCTAGPVSHSIVTDPLLMPSSSATAPRGGSILPAPVPHYLPSGLAAARVASAAAEVVHVVCRRPAIVL